MTFSHSRLDMTAFQFINPSLNFLMNFLNKQNNFKFPIEILKNLIIKPKNKIVESGKDLILYFIQLIKKLKKKWHFMFYFKWRYYTKNKYEILQRL